jgi:uncharacterized protein (TIGR02996 family)
MISMLVERGRERLRAADLEGALAALITAWQTSRAIELARAIDAIDEADPFEGTTDEWLAAARESTSHRLRGKLLRSLTRRTANDLVAVLNVATGWQDPRLSTQILALLRRLPFSGKRTREVWRDVFAVAREQRDPRFLELAEVPPGSWNAGAETRRFLGNRLEEANRGLAAPSALSPEVAKALAMLVEDHAPRRGQTEDDLLAAIYEHPDDDAPRLVYADWLLEREDPRGEFIALQLQGSTDKRVQQLFAKHKKALLGPLAPMLGGDLELRRGFVVTATARFRNQGDAEQHGNLPAWATLEDLTWGGGGIVRDDQVEWAGFIGPAMRNLRRARKPHPKFLLAGSHPWRIEELELDHRQLSVELVRQVVASPRLPALVHLIVHGGIPADWLDGSLVLPEHLTIHGQFENRRKWLAAAQPTNLGTLTIHDGLTRYHFRRDPNNELTRLELEVAMPRSALDTEPLHRGLAELIKVIGRLPAGSLTHFDAHIGEGGETAPVPQLLAVGAAKVR